MSFGRVGGRGRSLEDLDRTNLGVAALVAGTLTMFLSSKTWNEPLTGGGREKLREPLEGAKRNSTRIKIGKTFSVKLVIWNPTVSPPTSARGKTCGSF